MIVYGWGGSYNKRDWSYRWGACELCGHVGTLSSFTCTRFFSIYWVPLIPHGSRRFIDFCQSCKQGKAMALTEWKQLRSTSLRRAIRAFDAAPSDPEAAMKALGMIVSCGDEDQFQTAASKILKHHSNNAVLMADLGRALAYFGKLDEAKGALQRSLQIETNEDVQEALESFEQQRPMRPQPEPGPLQRIGPVLIAPAIVVTIIAVFLVMSITARPKNVFFVNGLDKAYSVLVNDKRVNLHPNSYVKVEIEFGPLSVRLTRDNRLPIEPVMENVDAGLTSRTSDKLLFVINPDRVAILARDEMVYSESATPSVHDKRKILVGQAFYRFDDIDYAFREPPKSVSMPGGSDYVIKKAFRQIPSASKPDNFGWLLTNAGKSEALTYAKRILLLEPGESTLLPVIANMMDQNEAMAFVKTQLATRPVLVNWHRTYQELCLARDPDAGLLPRYRKMLDADPMNRSLMYLTARLIDDPADAFAMFEQSTRGATPEPYGYYGMGYAYSCRAEFAKALKAVSKAIELAPDELNFQQVKMTLLAANERWGELAASCREALARSPYSLDHMIDLVATLTAAGDVAAAGREQETYLDKLGKLDDNVFDKSQLPSMAAILRSAQLLWQEDPAAFAKVAAETNNIVWRFRGALAKQDWAKASELMEKGPKGLASPLTRLALSALAQHDGNDELAARQLDAALNLLRAGKRNMRDTASWFAKGTSAPSLDETLRAELEPARRKLLLLALGVRHPSQREQYYALMKKLNFSHDAWYFPIKRILQEND